MIGHSLFKTTPNALQVFPFLRYLSIELFILNYISLVIFTALTVEAITRRWMIVRFRTNGIQTVKFGKTRLFYRLYIVLII